MDAYAHSHGHPEANAPLMLSDEQLMAMHEAKTSRKKIDTAVAVATFNGWSIGLFAGLSALALLFSFSLQGLLVTVGLAVVAYHEFKGKAMLKQLDTRAANLLGYNQIGLGVLIIGYCAWSLVAVFVGPDPYAEYIAQNPELGQVLGSTGELYRFGATVVYGLAIVLTVPYQAAVAWYYFSRAGHICKYVDQTPQWITQIQRAAA